MGFHRLALASMLVALQGCADSPDLPVPAAGTRGDLSDVSESEISLSRDSCFGVCPVYTVVYRRDGTVTYIGELHVDHVGQRNGRIGVHEFAELARFIRQRGFSDLDEWYRVRGTDMPTVVVTVKHRDGRTKTVSEYGESGPSSLWAIQRVVDGMLMQVAWGR